MEVLFPEEVYFYLFVVVFTNLGDTGEESVKF